MKTLRVPGVFSQKTKPPKSIENELKKTEGQKKLESRYGKTNPPRAKELCGSIRTIYKTTALPLSYASPRKVSQSKEGQSTAKENQFADGYDGGSRAARL
jgi:hypothetical protein